MLSGLTVALCFRYCHWCTGSPGDLAPPRATPMEVLRRSEPGGLAP